MLEAHGQISFHQLKSIHSGPFPNDRQARQDGFSDGKEEFLGSFIDAEPDCRFGGSRPEENRQRHQAEDRPRIWGEN